MPSIYTLTTDTEHAGVTHNVFTNKQDALDKMRSTMEPCWNQFQSNKQMPSNPEIALEILQQTTGFIDTFVLQEISLDGLNISNFRKGQLYNGYSDGKCPDWSQYASLELLPVQYEQEGEDTFCNAMLDVVSLQDERIVMWSVYALNHNGEAELITDIENASPTEIKAIAEELHKLSGLPLQRHPVIECEVLVLHKEYTLRRLVQKSFSELQAAQASLSDSMTDLDDASFTVNIDQAQRTVNRSLETLSDLKEQIRKLKSPNASQKSLTFVCPKCGSHDIQRDAVADWSNQDQDWQLVTVYDNATCQKCGEQGNIHKFEQFSETTND